MIKAISWSALALLLSAGLIFLLYPETTQRHSSELDYTLIKKDGLFEIRNYPKMVVAEITQKGAQAECIKHAFKPLADYIFGNNTPIQTIEMIMPLLEQETTANEWHIQMIMPQKYSLSSLPKPNNPNIALKEISEKKMITIHFAGALNTKNLQHHLKLIEKYIQEHHITTTGNAIFAIYNPSWSMPFLRKNEILFEMKNEAE